MLSILHVHMSRLQVPQCLPHKCSLSRDIFVMTVAAMAKATTRSPTAFERRLHGVCKRVPPGRVSTYGVLAKVLGSSPRAVGQALRRNPYAPEVPCHRIIATSLEIGGFKGATGPDAPKVQQKRALLESEGVKFEGSRVASKDAVLEADDF